MRALLVGLLMFPFAASADCMSWSWAVSPPAGSTVPSNARFVLEGFGQAQAKVANIASLNPRLVSGGARVPLEVVEINVGEMKLTQAVLKPKRALLPGSRYKLEFDEEGDVRFAGSRVASQSWTAAEADDVLPLWRSAPQAEQGRVVPMGCGPEVQARVQLDVTDTSALLLRARVSEGTAPSREYLLTPRRGQPLSVGHGMCSGEFRLPEGEWTLELIAVDAAGNSTRAPGKPLRFKGVNPVAD